MHKRLQEHISFIKKAATNPTPKLLTYHHQKLSEFQHERLIHLIVTMFFALFFIIFFIFTTTLTLTLPPSTWSTIFSASSAFITLVLFVTTIFYIRHYYQLENGIQKLESLTQKLHEL